MRFLIISSFLLLSACGPTLFTLGGIVNVTAGDIAITPIKKKILNKISKKPSKIAVYDD
jgi:hypothetical protein|tara:strand:+ start:486 stop:662 length:177 start_codon:yes stop_codon:yes gene_type:complete